MQKEFNLICPSIQYASIFHKSFYFNRVDLSTCQHHIHYIFSYANSIDLSEVHCLHCWKRDEMYIFYYVYSYAIYSAWIHSNPHHYLNAGSYISANKKALQSNTTTWIFSEIHHASNILNLMYIATFTNKNIKIQFMTKIVPCYKCQCKLILEDFSIYI